LESREVAQLPYSVRNYPFITSSKLKAFDYCPLAYKYEYIDLIEKPNEATADHFILGSAFDSLLTDGRDTFDNTYKVVSRRSKSDSDYNFQLNSSMVSTIESMEKEFKANPLFNHAPKKKLFFWQYRGHLIKIELDDYTGDAIRDIKTIANIKKIEPSNYLIQACLYHLVVEENTMQKLPVIYEYVDKHKISRSQAVEFSRATLESFRGQLFRMLDDLVESIELGLFMPTTDQEKLFDSPYYGYNGYGRPTKPLIY